MLAERSARFLLRCGRSYDEQRRSESTRFPDVGCGYRADVHRGVVARAAARRLTDNYLPDFQPSWSPDGRSIAFTSIRTGLSQIYRMRADGTRQRRLTHAFGNCDSPAWSPRGNLIAFHCAMANEKVSVM